MKILGLVPVNSLELAKSRLATAVPSRSELTLRLVSTVVTALLTSGRLAKVVVVSPDPRLAVPGADFLLDPAPGLNPALEGARRAFPGYDAVLVALGDLPELTGNDVGAMIDRLEAPGVVLAPDEAEQGTNLLLCAPALSLPFRFGPGSFQAHLKAAERAAIFRSPGTARDLDTPEQLAWIS